MKEISFLGSKLWFCDAAPINRLVVANLRKKHCVPQFFLLFLFDMDSHKNNVLDAALAIFSDQTGIQTRYEFGFDVVNSRISGYGDGDVPSYSMRVYADDNVVVRVDYLFDRRFTQPSGGMSFSEEGRIQSLLVNRVLDAILFSGVASYFNMAHSFSATSMYLIKEADDKAFMSLN